MFTISSNNIVKATRGDSFAIPIYINMGTNLDPEEYAPIPGSVLYFGLTRPNEPFENAVLKKTFTFTKDNCDCCDPKFIFTSEDTEYLEPGKYYYQIKGKLFTDVYGNFVINTIIPKTEFFLYD